MSQSEFQIPESFDGQVRLFPLPNVVLFPGVVQALNLFEPRYRQLISDSLDDDNLITMALVKPDSANLSMPVPEICQTVCIGKVMTHAQLENGTYNLLLAGISRAVIVDELVSDTLYRQARVDLLSETAMYGEGEQDLRSQLIDGFRETQIVQSQFDSEAIDKLESGEMSVGQLTDLIAYASGISPLEQQAVLEITDVRNRIHHLIAVLKKHNDEVNSESGMGRDFLPVSVLISSES